MNKRQIIKQTLLELKKKKLLRETPEGDSNKLTSDLQDCISELATLADQVDQMLVSSVDSEEQDTLNLMKNKVSYISTTLNNIITKQMNGDLGTENPADNGFGPALEEDMSKPAVNMSVDNVIKEPQVLKQLDDKQIDVNVVDKDGKSLVEEDIAPAEEQEIVNEAPAVDLGGGNKTKHVSVSLGRKTRGGVGVKYSFAKMSTLLSSRTLNNVNNVGKKLGITWTDGIAYYVDQGHKVAISYVIRGTNKVGTEFWFDRHETGTPGFGTTMVHTAKGQCKASMIVDIPAGNSVNIQQAFASLGIDRRGKLVEAKNLNEAFDGREEIKKYPYKLSLKKLGSDDIEKLIKHFKLVKHPSSKVDYSEWGYISNYFENAEKTVAFFSYTQRSTTFYDQKTIGFKNRQEALKLKQNITEAVSKKKSLKEELADSPIIGYIIRLAGCEDDSLAEDDLLQINVAINSGKPVGKDTLLKLAKAAMKSQMPKEYSECDYWELRSIQEMNSLEELLANEDVLDEEKNENFISGKSKVLVLEDTMSQNY